MDKDTEPRLSLKITEYLDLIFLYKHDNKSDFRGTATVPLSQGLVVRELDKEERYCHVEPAEEHAIIWHIRDWRTSITREERKRREAELNRKQYWLDKENITLISKELHKDYQRRFKIHIHSPEVLKPIAIKIVKERDYNMLKELNLQTMKLEATLDS